MKNKTHHIDPSQTHSLGNYKTYTVGFIISLALTMASYFVVVEHVSTGWVILTTLMGLGVTQAFIQLVFFLHLGKESKPDWNLITFFFMALVLVIIVIGSLWIMYHLEERTMPPMDHKHMMQHESM